MEEGSVMGMRWWMKACPKCRGDLHEDRAWGEREIRCLQCGHVLNEPETQQMNHRAAAASGAIGAGSSQKESAPAA